MHWMLDAVCYFELQVMLPRRILPTRSRNTSQRLKYTIFVSSFGNLFLVICEDRFMFGDLFLVICDDRFMFDGLLLFIIEVCFMIGDLFLFI